MEQSRSTFFCNIDNLENREPTKALTRIIVNFRNLTSKDSSLDRLIYF